MRLLFLVMVRESEKKTRPDFFKALESAISQVARPGTEVKIQGLSDIFPDTSEALYWYAQPRATDELCYLARKGEKEAYDGVVIGCVGAVEAEYAIKEALNIPVVGVSESSFLLALLLGVNFSLLTYADKTYAWLYRTVRQYGLEHKCASIRQAEIGVKEMLSKGDVAYEKTLEQAQLAIKEDRAEVIVLGSIGYAGMADYLRKRIDAPVVDPIETGVKFAEIMVDLHKSKGLLQSKVLTYKGSPNVDKFLRL